MSVLASAVMALSAVKLNDASQAIWTNGVLLPCLQSAYDELETLLNIAEAPIQKKRSAVITVEIGDVELDEYPADFIEPIKMEERALGSTELFVPMTETEWDVNTLPGPYLRWWDWRDNKILFLGATTDRDVRLYYTRSLTPLSSASINIEIPQAKNFLAARTAQIAAKDIGNMPTKAEEFEKDVEEAKDKLIRRLVKNKQGLGVRRMGYRGRR